jgi:isopentenyl-diphosphate delta-isomerase
MALIRHNLRRIQCYPKKVLRHCEEPLGDEAIHSIFPCHSAERSDKESSEALYYSLPHTTLPRKNNFTKTPNACYLLLMKLNNKPKSHKTTHLGESTTTPETVVLVDENDNDIGTMEKMAAHQNGGHLHRAFSGFVFNDRGELLIQRRAAHKYHNPNVWANTVCSHPRAGEPITAAVKRRLGQELGFELDFTVVGKFIYKATFPNGLTEWEYDNVCTAAYDGAPIVPNPAEVAETRWVTRAQLEIEIARSPDRFSFWLREILKLGIIKGW